MEITFIRNATIVLQYGSRKLLIDPYLAPKGAYPPVANTARQELSNPIAELPWPAEDLLPVDAVIVTHLHPDHFDKAAIDLLPKEVPVLAQSEADAGTIRSHGFTNVSSLEETSSLFDIVIHRTDGRHGTGEVGRRMGPVSGFVLEHPDEKTLYVAGDTIWCEEVEDAIRTHVPDAVIVNGGAAQFLEGDPITMTAENIRSTAMASENAVVLVAHMEAVNHCLLTRRELKEYIEANGLTASVLVPDDGDTITL